MARLEDVTIIIPLYVTSNERADWAVIAIHSALSQGCKVLLWDDGTPEDYHYIFGMQSMKQASLFGGQHIGVSFARNAAIQRIDTPLFLPLDNDDVIRANAVVKMLDAWNKSGGVPVYSDLIRVMPDERELLHRCLDFHCDTAREVVGMSSVNVLHSVVQWESVGGYNESLVYLEDAEYNARLYMTHCGVHIRDALFYYRQHSNQRSRQYKPEHNHHLNVVKGMMNDYYGGLAMQKKCGTCSGSKPVMYQSNRRANPGGKKMVVNTNIPGATGELVKAVFVGGKGKGDHYYKGRATKYPYLVHFNGVYDAVAVEDVNHPDSLFRRIEPAAPQESEKIVEDYTPLQEVVDVEPGLTTTARVYPHQKQPPNDGYTDEPTGFDEDPTDLVYEAPINLSEMNKTAIRSLNVSPAQAEVLLKQELNGKNRRYVIEFMEAAIARK